MDGEHTTLIMSSGYIDTAVYNPDQRTYDFAIVGCQHCEVDQDAMFEQCSTSFKDATRDLYFRISVREDVVKAAMMTHTVEDIDPDEFLGRQIVLNSKGLSAFREVIETPDAMFVDQVSFPFPEAA